MNINVKEKNRHEYVDVVIDLNKIITEYEEDNYIIEDVTNDVTEKGIITILMSRTKHD